MKNSFTLQITFVKTDSTSRISVDHQQFFFISPIFFTQIASTLVKEEKFVRINWPRWNPGFFSFSPSYLHLSDRSMLSPLLSSLFKGFNTKFFTFIKLQCAIFKFQMAWYDVEKNSWILSLVATSRGHAPLFL